MLKSELDDVELAVISVLPACGCTEVGVVQELTTALGPSDGLTLTVTVEDSRVCIEDQLAGESASYKLRSSA